MHRTGLPRSGMRVVAAALLLTFLIGGGTTGYLLLENWTLSESIYMTIITLTTVGFGEVRPLSAAGQHFTIVFLVVSVATVG
ncbi:MAG TPA: potassium channel family protein, partial [Alkalispirochaeta sp.]|nr:potassium channel family protein [Alkalispirochaeta sp.]